MTTQNAPPRDVPKSLHTLTVLVQVARLVREASPYPFRAEFCLDAAMRSLGLAGCSDPHGLRARALTLLEAAK